MRSWFLLHALNRWRVLLFLFTFCNLLYSWFICSIILVLNPDICVIIICLKWINRLFSRFCSAKHLLLSWLSSTGLFRFLIGDFVNSNGWSRTFHSKTCLVNSRNHSCFPWRLNFCKFWGANLFSHICFASDSAWQIRPSTWRKPCLSRYWALLA